MRVGKTIQVVVSPKRNVRKANEKKSPAEQPIPVEIPKKKKVKKEVEADALDAFRYSYRLSWGVGALKPVTYITGVS